MNLKTILLTSALLGLVACAHGPEVPEEKEHSRVTCFSPIGQTLMDVCSEGEVFVHSGTVYFKEKQSGFDVTITADCVVIKGAHCPRER